MPSFPRVLLRFKYVDIFSFFVLSFQNKNINKNNNIFHTHLLHKFYTR